MSRKKENLLEQAERLFYEHGFHAIGLKKVVTESGVALMTLYNHFQSKEDLIMEVLKRREARYFSSLKACLNEAKGEPSVALMEVHLFWTRRHGSNGCMFLRAKEEFANGNQAIVDYVDAHKKALIDFFQAAGYTNRNAIRLALLFEGTTALAETRPLDEVAEECLFFAKQIRLESDEKAKSE
ncbi:TetR/AcrR family transcriptional regulator [Alkalihalobacillus oceani]|uniref:TetR/AcrR family transcriptional regulator n=1 Tax=Halalkalibacter oceani TaxID=1653776 RepID=A0A9X2DQV0_9BACI|nr:TetR/AcrR family transcriptional regulator [Halalkalibacter oceani]MCM3715006.1 TetR/AcrR family transcriptional regulator [Halalkalibacter oceani]